MNFEPEIELYARGTAEVLYKELLEKLGEKGMVKLTKKLDLYQHMSVETLMRTKTLDYINGSNPRLYELKPRGLPMPVRFVCSIEGRKLVLLEVFYRSGAHGVVERHLTRASNRLVDWRARQVK